MNKFTRRLAAVVATGTLVVAGVALSAAAANADVQAGTITLYAKGSNAGVATPDASKVITSGSSSTNPMFWGLTINGTCPAGFRSGTNLAIFQNGTFMGALAQTMTSDLDGTYGSNGDKSSDTGVAMGESTTSGNQDNYVANKALDSINTPLASGAFELRYYCFADYTSPDFTADKFFSLTLNYNATAHTWNVPAPKANDTVSLTAATNTNNSATLTATVKKADGTTATDATGSVTFTEGSTTVGTGTVTNGVATFTTAVLSAGLHQYTATYGGDTTYNASPASGVASVSVAGSNGSPAATTITVAIPAGVGSITLSGVPTAVDLGTATVSGGRLVASNTTGFTGITVTDTRQLDAPNWTLTGQVSDFTSTSHTLLGKYLGWHPWILSGPGVAGAVVTPADPGSGLSQMSTLATGAVTDGQPTTVVKADLNLSAPADTPAGNYSAVLTVTLS